MSPFWKSVARAAVTGFVGAFVPLVSGIVYAPNWSAQKAAALSALVAAGAAAARAAWAVATKGETPFPNVGL